MAYELLSTRVASVVANEGDEGPEPLRPWQAVADAGGEPELVAPRVGKVETGRDFDRAGRFPVGQVTDRARATDYDAVLCRRGINTLLTGRGVADLDAFCGKLGDVFAGAEVPA